MINIIQERKKVVYSQSREINHKFSVRALSLLMICCMELHLIYCPNAYCMQIVAFVAFGQIMSFVLKASNRFWPQIFLSLFS